MRHAAGAAAAAGVAATDYAFASVTPSGGVWGWGDAPNGGEVPRGLREAAGGAGVAALTGGLDTFAAVRGDGRVAQWGGGIALPSYAAVHASPPARAVVMTRKAAVVLLADGSLM
eukprot:gene923-4137_t